MPSSKKPLFLRILRNLLIIVLASYIGVSLLLFFRQSSLVYFPTREITVTPRVLGLAFEEVSFTSADGTQLSGWFVPARNPRATVLHCHGNGGNISDRLDTIATLHALDLDVFIFDYHGYGLSQGKPTELGTYQDADAAWNYLTDVRKIAPARIVIQGHSLGGPIAAWLARKHTPAALILENTFPSMRDMASDLYPWLPVRWLLRFKYDTAQYIAGHTYPILVVHSPEDEIVPFEFGRKLFESASEPKDFLQISGSHSDAFLNSGKVYTDGLSRFLDQRLPRTPKGE